MSADEPTGGPPAASARRVVMVVEDLFFATRIATTAQLLGVALEPVPAARVLERCRASAPDLLIADLHGPGDPLERVRELKQDDAFRAIPVVGFYSHVDQALRERALAAGADRVMPRSAFTAKLAEILGSVSGDRSPPPGPSSTRRD